MSDRMTNLLEKCGLSMIDRVFYWGQPPVPAAQEATYVALRRKEGRLYDDTVVRQLPDFPHDHPLGWEWQLRAASARRLINVLQQQKPQTLLDLGCGNGWMSRLINEMASCPVLGLDLNQHELQQAARVFADRPELYFAYGDIFELPFPPDTFDAIVLASVIQYFPDLTALMFRLQNLLTPTGAIYVVDSPFYTIETQPAARERTRQHFEQLGFPAMAEFYHHHLWAEMTTFQPRIFYDPHTLRNRLRRRLSSDPRWQVPFPGLMITRQKP